MRWFPYACLAGGILALTWATYARPSECPILDQTGTPTLTVAANTQLVCHTAYAALDDLDALVPRWVAYPLTAAHTVGCNERKNNFHGEPLLPAAHRAVPEDYDHSGYDIGHQMLAADAEWGAASRAACR